MVKRSSNDGHLQRYANMSVATLAQTLATAQDNPNRVENSWCGFRVARNLARGQCKRTHAFAHARRGSQFQSERLLDECLLNVESYISDSSQRGLRCLTTKLAVYFLGWEICALRRGRVNATFP